MKENNDGKMGRERVFNDYGLDVTNIEFVITSPYRTKEYVI